MRPDALAVCQNRDIMGSLPTPEFGDAGIATFHAQRKPIACFAFNAKLWLPESDGGSRNWAHAKQPDARTVCQSRDIMGDLFSPETGDVGIATFHAQHKPLACSAFDAKLQLPEGDGGSRNWAHAKQPDARTVCQGRDVMSELSSLEPGDARIATFDVQRRPVAYFAFNAEPPPPVKARGRLDETASTYTILQTCA